MDQVRAFTGFPKTRVEVFGMDCIIIAAHLANEPEVIKGRSDLSVRGKDGLYLVKAVNMGIKEYDPEGMLCSVPTGLYSSNIRDAMPTADISLAKSLGGKVVDVPTLKEVRK